MPSPAYAAERAFRWTEPDGDLVEIPVDANVDHVQVLARFAPNGDTQWFHPYLGREGAPRIWQTPGEIRLGTQIRSGQTVFYNGESVAVQPDASRAIAARLTFTESGEARELAGIGHGHTTLLANGHLLLTSVGREALEFDTNSPSPFVCEASENYRLCLIVAGPRAAQNNLLRQ